MKNIKMKIAKLKFKFGNREAIKDYYRSLGVKIGENCNICSRLPVTEGYLLEIGNNCVISYGVDFVTHDASFTNLFKRTHIDLYGKIILGDNCFIGANSTILYGVELGKNTIVATRSVVTHSFPEGNVVLAGNPARVICTTEEFIAKNEKKLIDTKGLDFEGKKNKVLNSTNLIIRK